MLKLTFHRFAVLGLSAIVSASAGISVAQLTDTPAVPRLDTPRSNEAEPEADSRAGGALAQDADPVEGADIVDDSDLKAAADEDLDPDDGDLTLDPDDRISRQGIDRDADGRDGVIDVEGDDLELGEAETTAFIGPVTAVGDGTITVKLGPPRIKVAKNQTFKISDRTPVVVDGRRSSLKAIKKGSTVRVIALAGDPEVAAQIFVGTPPAARESAREAVQGEAPQRTQPAVNVGEATDSEDRDPHFDVYPGKDSAETPPRRTDPRVARRAMGGEEAVLSLGIEVYGHGPSGALVTEMLAAAPAAEAGMQIGDLLIAVNNKGIPDPEMIEQLMFTRDGTVPVELTVMRNGQQLQLAVSPWQVMDNGLVTEAAIQQALATHGVAVGGAGAVLPLGATGFSDFANGGVTVSGTEDALLGGLLPNDVVTGVNGQPIRNRAALLDALNGLPQDAENFALDVLRDGQRTTLDVPRTALGQNFGVGTRQGTGLQQGTGQRQGTGSGFPREGRSAAAQPGAISGGRSDAARGSITSGRSQAAPGNTLPGIQPPAGGQQNVTPRAGGTGTDGTGTGTGGVGGTGTGGTGTGTGGTGTPQ